MQNFTSIPTMPKVLDTSEIVQGALLHVSISIVLVTVVLSLREQTLLQNGFFFNIVLFAFKLALLTSFKVKYCFDFWNEVRRTNLKTNKRILK